MIGNRQSATEDDLRRVLWRIDGRGYKAYKDIEGAYRYRWFELSIDHAQADPFAPPSRLRAIVPQERAKFPSHLFRTDVRRIALQDFLAREFARSIERIVRGRRGTGKSGIVLIDRCGQEVLERTAIVVDDLKVEARFSVGLPAAGRSVLAREAEELLLKEIPEIVRSALYYDSIDKKAAEEHVRLAEGQAILRGLLREKGLVAFVGDNSVLPRESGTSDRPLVGPGVVRFSSPPELRVEFDLPNHGRVSGMGIPRGVTLIVGGGYHGKSTLLRAIERGVYDHIKGDGREWVISLPETVKIRAEDGRRVENVNISPFINDLPQGVDTRSFSTELASGSTSQAANIMEALEMGAKVLLLDEDTSATNFMIRDLRMQELVAKSNEPITPFIDKVRQLYEELGVSTILVAGGSGEYFDVADTVIMMNEYRAYDVTANAREIARRLKTDRHHEGGETFGIVNRRIPLPMTGFSPARGVGKGRPSHEDPKISARGTDALVYGKEVVDLRYVEQLVDPSQVQGIGLIMRYAYKHYIDGRRTLREVLQLVDGDISRNGLDILSPYRGGNPGDYARPRIFEVASALNRLGSFRAKIVHG